MKRTILMILSLICVMSVTAGAKVLDDVSFNRDADTITVIGNSDGEDIGSAITLYVIDTENDVLNEDSSNVEYIEILKVENYNSYTHTFGFDDVSGKYVIGAVDEKGNRISMVYDYYNDDVLSDFADRIGNGTMSQTELESYLNQYAQSLNINSEFLNNNRDKSIILTHIRENRNSIANNGLTALTAAVDTAVVECSILKEIENCVTWYEIDELIINNADFIGINKTKWQSSNSRQNICSGLMDKQIANLASLADSINSVLNKKSGKEQGGPGGGGGSVSFAPSTNTGVSQQSSGFVDLEGAEWATEAILALSKAGIINGVGNNRFSPNDFVKREELAKMIVLAFGIETNVEQKYFSDVESGSWYASYVSALCQSGISNGISDSKFGSGLDVTRQDIAVILYRIMNKKGFSFKGEKKSFVDEKNIAEYAMAAVGNMAAEGIINGVGNNAFAPTECATRAQAAKLIYEVKNQIGKRRVNL